MARSATTSDTFNAIAEVRRREILGLLAKRELSVGELVDSMGVTQPQVSKHFPEHCQRVETGWNYQLQQVKQRADK